MDVARNVELLRAVGSDLAGSAAAAGLSAAVPSCPGWVVRDLVEHMAKVHDWARTIVAEALAHPGVPAPEPPRDGLIDWFRAGHAALVTALAAAPPDLECFTFLPSPSPLQFWSRRQLHETAIHRVDAGLANGESIRFEADLAADGIDEIVTGFLPRPTSPLRLPTEQTVAVHATDADRAWHIVLGPDTPVGTELEDGQDVAADCTVRGAASDVYLLLWNRRNRAGLDVHGDVELLDTWRSQMLVRSR